MTAADLPGLNAALNGLSGLLLLAGFAAIKNHRPDIHKKFMLAALVSSAAFLTSYLIYHAQVGSVPYPHFDWTRTLYFIILIPHVILAGLMVPFIVAAVYFALRQQFERHKRLVVWVWPVWMFVSVTGVVIYFMLYQL